MTDHHIHDFPNGIRLVHKQVNNTKVIHCGFIIDLGSRDEDHDDQGIAHFWEHMAFKGTHKRKAYHIINRLESLGGELNAFTTKEKICFYASVLDEHFDKALDLLTDITFHSIFPEKQIEKERLVILDEMAMYKDNPDDAIMDDFDRVIFGDHPLGNNIIGTEESVNGISKKSFQKFLEKNISTDRIVFSVVGSLAFKKVLKLSQRYIGEIESKLVMQKRREPDKISGIKETKRMAFNRAYAAIGRSAYPVHSDKRMPFFMLVNILGGPAMNSRLNMSLRENFGYVYSIDASYHSFIDSGMFAIYFGTEQKYLNRSVNVVHKELKKLRDTRLGSLQFHMARQQLKGQLAISEENNTSLMLMMGRSLLDIGKIDSLEEVFIKIESITSSQIQDIANELFVQKDLNYLFYQPR